MKRFISMFLAAVMMLSLVGCGSASDSSEAKDGFYKVCGVYYPEELGAPVLGESAKELDLSTAAEQITNVGDALYFISAIGAEKSAIDIVTLFVDLVNYDYDDVGTIKLTRMDSGETHTLVYVKSGEKYHPFDPCCMKRSDFLESKKARAADSDLDSLGKRLASYYPRPNGARAEYETKSLSSFTKEEYAIIKHLITPQYTEEQIKQWVTDGLTLDEWAEKITTFADVTCLLHVLEYQIIECTYGFFDETTNIQWVGGYNAQIVFNQRGGNCRGTSHLINTLLSGDFDEQGYVSFSAPGGGHIFNYFVVDGVYFVCDFIGIVDVDLSTENILDYILYVGEDKLEFGDWYRKEGPFSEGFEDPNSLDYLLTFEMYPREGSSIPAGCNQETSPFLNSKSTPWLADIRPEQNKDQYTFLFVRDGYPIRFMPIPDESTWPAEIR